MSVVDIIQIVIGGLSLLATIAVSFTIYWLQRHHEKDIEREAKEKAKMFLMENEAERGYLPWCVLAANLHRLERHTRNIYTAFCRCPEELRNEILRQTGFQIGVIKDKTWVNDCIEKLKTDIEKYGLGRDWLYDGAKYFHRSYERYRETEWNETPCVFKPINKDSKIRNMFNINQISIGGYVDEYFYYYIDKHMEFEQEDIPISPIDYVCYYQNFENCKEKDVCMWLMDLIENIAIIIRKRKSDEEINQNLLEYKGSKAETFEDKYYEVLQALYNTYYLCDTDNKRTKKKRKCK